MRSNFTRRWIRGAAILAGAAMIGGFAGCGQQSSATPGCPDKEGEAHDLAMTGTKVRVVNAMCPIAGSHGVGKDMVQDAALVREFKGQNVGFCCQHCLPVWDKLSDEKKQAALDAATSKKSAG
ncbi:MAG: hypothetical protein K2W85_14165 [Phycisphaerales bacterium]|nr:hypothetical protein [Phycisphaerales bacterium]